MQKLVVTNDTRLRWPIALCIGAFMLGAGALSLFDAWTGHTHGDGFFSGDGRGISLTAVGLLVAVWAIRWGWRHEAVATPSSTDAARTKDAHDEMGQGKLDGQAGTEAAVGRAVDRGALQLSVANDGVDAEPTVAQQVLSPTQTQRTPLPKQGAPAIVKMLGAPKIVAIGGGTGMPQLLRGLREYTDSITAIVTVADDGGSSGRLRRQMGMLPPGDFRNNIAALSESEELLTRLFQYRFARYDAIRSGQDKNELAGHSFGNLFIATMAAVSGSFESGLAESSRVLAVRGRVLPSTLEQVHLCAEICRQRSTQNGQTDQQQPLEDEWLLVEGESQIPEAGGQIMRVFLKPETPPAYPEAIRAILQADLIVAGPGSFFTSIVPNLLVPGIRDAICASTAPSIYICNITTQPGETDHFTVSDHMLQLRRHAGEAFVTVLANNNYDLDTPPSPVAQWVALPQMISSVEQVSELVGRFPLEYRLFTGNLVDAHQPSHHDAAKLAARLMEVYARLS